MTILEAYRKAVGFPIKDLPRLVIQRPGGKSDLYLKEDVVEGTVCIVDASSFECDDYSVTLSLGDLMSEEWEVVLGILPIDDVFRFDSAKG